MKIKYLMAVAIAVVSTFSMGLCVAQTATADLHVSATVSAGCSVTADNLTFGTYDPTAGSPDDAQGNISVDCTNGTSYTVKLNGGSVGANIAERKMGKGSDRLGYNIFTNAEHTTYWGDGTTGSTLGGTGTGNLQQYAFYGRIFAGQFEPEGAYTDTVGVSVDY